MRFTKISIKPTDRSWKVVIHYERGIDDKYTVEVGQEPHPDFREAMKALRPDVIDLCELQDTPDRIEVRGLTISHGDDDRRITITALRTLYNRNTPLVLNTPCTKEDELSTYTLERIGVIEKEANLFLNGKRAQANLFDEEDALPDDFEEHLEPIEA